MLQKWQNRLTEFKAVASVRQRLIGLSLIRICYGSIILAYYAQHIEQRGYLWGNNGVVPFGLFWALMRSQRNFSLYMLLSSPIYQAAIFYLGFLVTIAFTLGYRTRISTILFYVFTWSLFQRNPFLLDGGDNFVVLPANLDDQGLRV